MKVIEEIREPMGLKGTTIAVLRAALSFIRSDDISEERHETHVCFASNASLAKRAHVSVQTVERHVAKLVASGLLQRVSSGNGKRWARRDAQGRIVFATGLSVMPLIKRHEEFLALAEDHAEKQLKLTLLRDQCAIKLAELLQCGRDCVQIKQIQSRARNLLRRKPNHDTLSELLSEIIKELSKWSSNNAEELRGADTRIEGHKETPLNQSVQEVSNQHIHVSEADMQASYPKLCLELRFAGSQRACERLMHDLAQQLGLGTLWQSIKDLGPALSFMILGYLLERIDHIQNPRAYAWRLMQDLSNETVKWQSLLKTPREPHSSDIVHVQ